MGPAGNRSTPLAHQLKASAKKIVIGHYFVFSDNLLGRTPNPRNTNNLCKQHYVTTIHPWLDPDTIKY